MEYRPSGPVVKRIRTCVAWPTTVPLASRGSPAGSLTVRRSSPVPRCATRGIASSASSGISRRNSAMTDCITVFGAFFALTLRGRGYMPLILLIVIVVLLVGALPTWPHSSGWGYYPSGGLGLVLLVLLVLFLTGRI